HDAFEDADAFLKPLGLGRILGRPFRGFMGDRRQLPFLEFQVSLVHVGGDAEDHRDADDDEEEAEDKGAVHRLSPQFAGRRSASISLATRWLSSVTRRSIPASRPLTS